MKSIVESSHKNTSVMVMKSQEIIIPLIVGFFKPTVFLPDIHFKEDELQFILIHEWFHFLYRDAWIKIFIAVLHIAFWWNPFIHIFKKDLNQILELRCDLGITSKMTEAQRSDYLKTIKKMIKLKNLSIKFSSFDETAAVSGLVNTDSTVNTVQRFQLVLANPRHNKSGRLSRFLVCGVMVATLLFSYMFIIQPYNNYPPESKSEKLFDELPKHSYLVDNGDGSFSLYVEDRYKATITDIKDELFSNMKIMKKE